MSVGAKFGGSLWVLPGGRGQDARQVTAAVGNPGSLRDGHIVFQGRQDLRRIRIDGLRSALLPTHGRLIDLRASGDGRWIVFSSYRPGGRSRVWRAAADGTQARQLTPGNGEKFADISPNGRWIVYIKVPEFTLWRLGVDGNSSTRLLGPYVRTPVISPDERWIAASYRPDAKTPWSVVVIPAEGGTPVRTLPISGFAGLSWSPDGQALDYVEEHGGIDNLWRIPLAGGKAVQLTDFDSDSIKGFDWSVDGRLLAVVRGRWRNDALLLRHLP